MREISIIFLYFLFRLSFSSYWVPFYRKKRKKEEGDQMGAERVEPNKKRKKEYGREGNKLLGDIIENSNKKLS